MFENDTFLLVINITIEVINKKTQDMFKPAVDKKLHITSATRQNIPKISITFFPSKNPLNIQ